MGNVFCVSRRDVVNELTILQQQHDEMREDMESKVKTLHTRLESLRNASFREFALKQHQREPNSLVTNSSPVSKPALKLDDLLQFMGKDEHGNKAVYFGVFQNKSAQPTCLLVGADTSVRFEKAPQDVSIDFAGTKVAGTVVVCFASFPWLTAVELSSEVLPAPPTPQTEFPHGSRFDVSIIHAAGEPIITATVRINLCHGIGSVSGGGSVQLGDAVARRVEGGLGWELVGVVVATEGCRVKDNDFNLEANEFCMQSIPRLLETAKGSWYWEKYPEREAEPALGM